MISVAIQGVRGSYSEEAVCKIVGADASIVECVDFADTFDAVTSRRAELAVVPVANKIVGEIEGSMEILRTGKFLVLERYPLRISHVLAGMPNATFKSLKTVTSHIEALKQCSQFFTANPDLKQVIGVDTASSIRRIVENGVIENAAICSRRAAAIYGAAIIAENIADEQDNWTTFYLIWRNKSGMHDYRFPQRAKTCTQIGAKHAG